jgi:hypothetical protein
VCLPHINFWTSGHVTEFGQKIKLFVFWTLYSLSPQIVNNILTDARTSYVGATQFYVTIVYVRGFSKCVQLLCIV